MTYSVPGLLGDFKCLPKVAFGTILHSFYESLREDVVGSPGAGLVLLVSGDLSGHGQSSDHMADSVWQPRVSPLFLWAIPVPPSRG